MLFKIALFVFIARLAKCEEFKVTDQVFLDLECDGARLGRVIIGLFGEAVPRTVANFKQIATHGIDGKTFEGTRLHRVVERFMVQGGDIVNNDGTGSVSIYGRFFPDENFRVRHNGPGMVSMANGGRNTNGCQFFITTMRTPWLDGKHVVFGKVVKGQDIVHRIEHMKTDSDYVPLKTIKIARCGLIKTKKPYYESDEPYELTLWAWIKAGWFPLLFSFAILGFFQWLMMKMNPKSLE